MRQIGRINTDFILLRRMGDLSQSKCRAAKILRSRIIRVNLIRYYEIVVCYPCHPWVNIGRAGTRMRQIGRINADFIPLSRNGGFKPK